METDSLPIADREFCSRLLLGTAQYPDADTLLQAINQSNTEMVTVSLRRVNIHDSQIGLVLKQALKAPHILPNTAGCYTAREAILTAQLAREALGTNWIKLEVIADDHNLLPDAIELLKAAQELVDQGFIVLPYCNDDPIVCKQLCRIGCAAVMPLGSPIGSGMGMVNTYNLRIIREQISIPIILDAGIGTASDVTLAMEMGLDAVLVNSAIAKAEHPVAMANAMKHAAIAGRQAYLAGRIPKKMYAEASSPSKGIIGR